jgi:uncharacterized protein YkwD
MIRCTLSLILFLTLSSSALAVSYNSPVHRVDLYKKLHKTLCQKSPDALPFENWKLGVYDAQIKGEYLRSSRGRISPLSLVKKAKALASSRGHYGYAYGVCKSNKAWLITTPSPEPLLFVGDQMIFPNNALKRLCRQTKISFAGTFGGQPLKLAHPKPRTLSASLNIKKLPAGTIAINCRPKRNVKRGYTEWFLAPIGKGPLVKLPFSKSIPSSFNKHTSKKFLDWINTVRTKNKLKATRTAKALKAAAKTLSSNFSIDHNMNLLYQVTKKTAFSGLNLLGENRATAASPYQIAWLFYNSPSHRKLLLSPNAEFAAIRFTGKKTEKLAIFVNAKRSGF